MLGLKDGDSAKVISRRGEVVTPLRRAISCRRGHLHGFPLAEANPNELLGISLDPISKTPDYKVCAVKIEALGTAV